MRTTPRILARLAPLASALVLASCQSDTGDGITDTGTPAGVGLSFNVPANASFSRDGIAGGGHSLDLTKVEMVVVRVRMRLADQTEPGCAGPNEAHPCIDFKVAPTLVDLPLHGGIVTPIIANIPDGSYRFLLVNIVPPTGEDSATRIFRASNNWPREHSMRVRGSFDGQPFDVYLPARAEIYNKLDPPFTVNHAGKTTLNVTVAVDPRAWFRSGDALIDPRLLSGNKALMDVVTNNIRASIHAFSDNQRHGG